MQNYVSTLVSKREELGRVCRVFKIEDINLFFQCLKYCVGKKEDVIGVIGESLDKSLVAPLKSMAIYHRFPINLVIADPESTSMPLLNHVLHDEHWLVGTVESVSFGEKEVPVHELPVLLASDPVCTWYGFRVGDIVCCKGIQPFSKTTECYQIVKHDLQCLTGSFRNPPS